MLRVYAVNAALTEQSMDLALIQPAVSTVRTVVGSEIWQRANRSDHCLVEVPFQMLQPKVEHKLPTILRGVIDLVFRESNGWVIVDYKTDAPSNVAEIEARASQYRVQMGGYTYSLSQATGRSVKEAVLLFLKPKHEHTFSDIDQLVTEATSAAKRIVRPT